MRNGPSLSRRRQRGRLVVARGEHYRQRYKAEPGFVYLGKYRLRWEQLFGVYRSDFACAIMRLCVARRAPLSETCHVAGGSIAAQMRITLLVEV
jgi:hypothetical protein